MIASELALEAPPPFSSFARHAAPDFQEAPRTKLLDSRWVDAVMYRVKELDEYAERKAKLGKSRKGGGGNQEDVEADPKPKKRQEKGERWERQQDGAAARCSQQLKVDDQSLSSSSSQRLKPASEGPSSSQQQQSQQSVPRVPGARASTVRVQAWWDSACRSLLQTSGSLKSFFKSLFRKPVTSLTSRSTVSIFPMPLPYQSCFRAESLGDVSPGERSFQRGLCLAILVLNWTSFT